MISIEDMFNRAMAIKYPTVITLTDLMSEKEIEVWNSLNKAQRVGIELPFYLMLTRNRVDRRIAPSIKLDDDRIFINPHIE